MEHPALAAIRKAQGKVVSEHFLSSKLVWGEHVHCFDARFSLTIGSFLLQLALFNLHSELVYLQLVLFIQSELVYLQLVLFCLQGESASKSLHGL